MHILAHRGYWNESIVKNSPDALHMALTCGYGFESDVRDYMGRMVISHNIADGKCQDAEEVFQWLSQYQDQYCFAINIKADGLKDILLEYLGKYNIKNYFLFDMSVPQMVEFEECKLRFFTRQSEIESLPCMYDKAAGVWIDGFWGTDWITEELLKTHLDNGKEICIVSPELHGRRDYKEFWEKMNSFDLYFEKVYICTDYPVEAKEFFYGK